MKLKFYLLLALLVITVNTGVAKDLDSLLTILDNTISSSSSYFKKREQTINDLKSNIGNPNIPNETTYQINESLFLEYKSYMCDSAIAYLNKNIALATQMKDTDKITHCTIQLSYLLSSSGMYTEAIELLKHINKAKLSKEQLIDYYVAYDHVYGELGFYTQYKDIGKLYTEKSNYYKDSIYHLVQPTSDLYLTMQETALRDKGDLQNAMAINDKRLRKVDVNSHNYAVIMYYRALIFREAKNMDDYMKCLALSAIADIRSAVTDHTSLWMLAQAIYDKGDIDRAYLYMDFSWKQTKLYNARLRVLQSTNLLSLIDNTYQTVLQSRNKELRLYILSALCLSFLLLVALSYIYWQMKKLRIARKNLIKAYTRLTTLNEELKNLNLSLQSANIDLAESNKIKEEYIARFIKLCSTYVDRLDLYRRMVHKKLTSNRIQELLELTRSERVQEEALRELYANFDSAFLHLFPQFVRYFNDLLKEGEQIILKDNETLNTELRIFALIRLGITDSSQIAEFLHYSVNTIYNYRAKVKNKARVPREEFEKLVQRIR